MKKICSSIMFFLLMSGVSLASPVPDFQPPVVSVFPPPSVSPYVPPQATDVFKLPPSSNPSLSPSLELIDRLSGVPYYSRLKDLGLLPSNPQPLGPAIPNADQVLPLSSYVSPSYNMTSDSNQDVEPSVMAYNSNGTVYKSTTYIKILSDGITPRIYYSTTPDFYTFYRGQLSLPSGYTYAADPLMSKNAINGGVAPGRIYTTGLIYNPSPGIPNGIAVWYSDDGGRSWSQPTIVISNTSDQTSAFDKPAINVSWYSGSLGYVYAAYVYMYGGTTPPTTYIGVSRSTDGGLTFPQTTVPFFTTDSINGVQVLVDYYRGYVYVLWNDFNQNTIYMSTSQDNGQTWSSPETVASGNMCNANAHLNGGVRAGSLPMARFNWVANKISIVWHEWQVGGPNCSPPPGSCNCNNLPAGSCNTDVYYTAKNSTSPPPWPTKVRLNGDLTNDKFQPALDFDTTGNLMVTFYNRKGDPNNLLYGVTGSHIDSSGNKLETNFAVNTWGSDPTKYNFTQYQDFIGDYHDIWDQTISNVDNYFSAWVGIPVTTGIGDIYMSTIVP